MTRNDLIVTASAIPEFTDAAAAEYGQKKDSMVAEINEYMLARADIEELVGPGNIEMMKDNHANHALFIESMLTAFNATVLVETIAWVFTAYRSRNFHSNYWAAQLHAWTSVMKKSLSAEACENIMPLYVWMTINIPQFAALTENQDEHKHSQ